MKTTLTLFGALCALAACAPPAADSPAAPGAGSGYSSPETTMGPPGGPIDNTPEPPPVSDPGPAASPTPTVP